MGKEGRKRKEGKRKGREEEGDRGKGREGGGEGEGKGKERDPTKFRDKLMPLVGPPSILNSPRTTSKVR